MTTDCAELSCSVTSAIMTEFSVISDTTTLMPDTYITSDSSVAGGWGGTCSCPSGIPYVVVFESISFKRVKNTNQHCRYEVGDNFDSCESLACIGGTEETCTCYVLYVLAIRSHKTLTVQVRILMVHGVTGWLHVVKQIRVWLTRQIL